MNPICKECKAEMVGPKDAMIKGEIEVRRAFFCHECGLALIADSLQVEPDEFDFRAEGLFEELPPDCECPIACDHVFTRDEDRDLGDWFYRALAAAGRVE